MRQGEEGDGAGLGIARGFAALIEVDPFCEIHLNKFKDLGLVEVRIFHLLTSPCKKDFIRRGALGVVKDRPNSHLQFAVIRLRSSTVSFSLRVIMKGIFFFFRFTSSSKMPVTMQPASFAITVAAATSN